MQVVILIKAKMKVMRFHLCSILYLNVHKKTWKNLIKFCNKALTIRKFKNENYFYICFFLSIYNKKQFLIKFKLIIKINSIKMEQND